jgi:hypothetical protein
MDCQSSVPALRDGSSQAASAAVFKAVASTTPAYPHCSSQSDAGGLKLEGNLRPAKRDSTLTSVTHSLLSLFFIGYMHNITSIMLFFYLTP